MHKAHAALRDEVAPEFIPPQWPHSVEQSSTDNTPIEGFWRWLRDGEGHSVKMTLQQGAATGIFLPHDAIHRRCYQPDFLLAGKLNASGSSPYNMFNNPTGFVATARDCSIRVNPESVYRLRDAYGGEEARDKAFRFVSREFAAEADGHDLNENRYWAKRYNVGSEEVLDLAVPGLPTEGSSGDGVERPTGVHRPRPWNSVTVAE
ncbi:hypothetical protein B0H14DRAFT_2599821 [Mycena olivaceomarginata]|nr:hypothetical protein B0H14DRAFT_2599821 [Mycena olivaceomarginata]